MGVLDRPKPFRAKTPKKAKRKPARSLAHARRMAGRRNREVEASETPSDAIAPYRAIVTTTATPGITPIPSRIVARRKHVGFDRERAAYRKAKASLLPHATGRFVVFVGDEMEGPFPTFRDAMRAGYRKFGLGPLYIKQVQKDEPVVDLGFPS